MSILTAPLVRMSEHGLVVAPGTASVRWPLVGVVGSIAWAFDGSRLTIIRIKVHRSGWYRLAADRKAA